MARANKSPRSKIRGEINASKRVPGISTGGGLIAGGITYKVYQRSSKHQRGHTRGNIHTTNTTYYR
jgi:hypothetical protein